MEIVEHLISREKFSKEHAATIQSKDHAVMYSCEVEKVDCRITLILPPTGREFRYFGVHGFKYLAPSSAKRSVMSNRSIRSAFVDGKFVDANEYRGFSASDGYDSLWEFSKCGESLQPYYSEMLRGYAGKEFCTVQHIGQPEPGHPAEMLYMALSASTPADKRSKAIERLIPGSKELESVIEQSAGYEHCITGVMSFGRLDLSFGHSGVNVQRLITDLDFEALKIAQEVAWPHFEFGLSGFPSHKHMANAEIEGKYFRGNYAPDYLEKHAELERGVVMLVHSLRDKYPVLATTPEEYVRNMSR